MRAIKINDIKHQKIEETEVIKKIKKGEKELYEILIRRNNQKLYRVIRAYLTDEAEIEDTMQNSYIKAYTKLYQFKMTASFSTWLIRIGINEALARIREKSKTHYLSARSNDHEHTDILEIYDSKELNPQDKMIQREATELLEATIDNLKEKYRVVYILKEVEGMSIKEIAETLDLTVENVKIRAHRAKQMLKENLYQVSQNSHVFEFGFYRCDRVTETVMNTI